MNTAPLFEQLCCIETLQKAWEDVQSKKAAGGIDDISVADFEAQLPTLLTQLLGDLRANSYTPQPYEHLLVPKDEGEFRRLGMLTIRDKTVQVNLHNFIDL